MREAFNRVRNEKSRGKERRREVPTFTFHLRSSKPSTREISVQLQTTLVRSRRLSFTRYQKLQKLPRDIVQIEFATVSSMGTAR